MNECNSIETIDRTNLTELTKIRLNKITEIENYFHEEINQKKLCSKKLSKYVAAFDFIGKILIVLSATTRGVPIILFTSVVGAPVGIASASFTSIFSLGTGIVKKEKKAKKTKHHKKKKRKSMIRFLCWLKVNLIASKH